MATAFYNLETGMITGTVSPSLENPDQILELENSGIGVVEVPEGINSCNSIISPIDKSIIPIS